MKTLFVLMTFTLIIWPMSSHAKRRYAPVTLNAQLSNELNTLLKATNEMHSAFFEQDEEKIESSLSKVVLSIEMADRKSKLAAEQKTHLKKMLSAARSGMQMTKNTTGEERKSNLKKALRQIVQIAQTYNLDKYKIFFCPKDKAVWLQKSWKAKNPVHPKRFSQCGKLVR